MSQYPVINDKEYDLLKKLVTNTKEIADNGGGGGGGTPGGSNGQIQYNNAGAFGGLDSTGTGDVVRETNPTLVGFTLSGATVTEYTAMGGTVVDVTKPGNTYALTSDGQTLSYNPAAPTAGTRTILKITTDATARSVGIPSTWSIAQGANITSISVPASSVLTVLLEYTGAQWEIFGDPVPSTGTGSFVRAVSPTLTTPALGTPSAVVLTNGTGLPTGGMLDDAVTLGKMAHGTAGNLITFDATGAPAAVATGTAAQVLTSNGAGAAPTFQAAPAGNVATDAIWDAKGDLAVGTGANTAARLAVGNRLQQLLADSDESTGLIWARRPFAGTIRQSSSVPGSTVASQIGRAVSASGTGSANAPTATQSQFLRYASAATTNTDAGWIDSAVSTSFELFPTFIARVAVSDVALGVQRVWVGLTSSASTQAGAADPATNFAGFRFDTSVPDANWQLVTNDGAGGGTITDSAVAVTAAQVTLEVVLSSGLVKFFINGLYVGEHSTELPTGTALIMARLRTLENVAKNLDIVHVFTID